MIDTASRGALVHKTVIEVMSLIANMAANSQQFGVRTKSPAKLVHEVSVSSPLDRHLANLT